MEYRILEGTDDHLDEVARLWVKLMQVHERYDLKQFAGAARWEDFYYLQMEEYVSDSSKTLLVLEVEGEVRGYVTAKITYGSILYNSIQYCSIQDIMVDEAYRRNGLGKLLVGRAMEWGKGHHVHRYTLNVMEYNTASLALFHSMGFKDSLRTLELESEYPTEIANPEVAIATKKEKKEIARPISDEMLAALLPSAIGWAEQQEQYALEHGFPLDRELKELASSLGIKEIGRVRLLKVDQIPFPFDPELREAAILAGMMNRDTLALTVGYGIYIRADRWYDRGLLYHELYRAMQFERGGGIEQYLSHYLTETIEKGYGNTKVDKEARLLASNYIKFLD